MPTSPWGAWLGWLAAGDTAAATIQLRRAQITQFAKTVDLLSATEQDVTAFLSRPGLATETRRSRKAALSSFYGWAYRTGLIDVDPTAMLHRIKAARHIPRPIAEADLARAFSLADEETALMLALGAYAGLRRGEITRFHSDCVTAFGLIITGKGDRTRRIPIHPILRPYLDRVDGWAFPSPRIPGQPVTHTYIEDRLHLVLPDGVTPHALRHRFATATYAACRDITVVQRLLGHANVATTMSYVALVDDDLDAAVALVA